MDIRRISFRLLQVYIEVVRAGSVSHAARQMHLTQPTVSAQLKKLVEEVGEPLLESRSGKLVTTDAGRELYRASVDVLGRFDDFNDYIDELRGGQSGRFSIGIVTTAKYVMPRVLGVFARQFPHVDVTLNIGNREKILQRFEQQMDDLYVFSHPPALHQAVAAKMVRNPLVFIAPPDHWSANAEQPLSFEQLLGERFLLREPGSATRMMFDAWLRSHGHQLGNVMQVESNEAIRLSVASNLGVTVLSRHTVSEGSDPVSMPAVKGLPIECHWYLLAHTNRRLPHAARQFLTFIGQHLDDAMPQELLCNEIDSLIKALEPS